MSALKGFCIALIAAAIYVAFGYSIGYERLELAVWPILLMAAAIAWAIRVFVFIIALFVLFGVTIGTIAILAAKTSGTASSSGGAKPDKPADSKPQSQPEPSHVLH